MCVISNVMDQFNPWFPGTVPDPSNAPDWSTIQWPSLPLDLTEARKLVDEFKEAVEHAKRLDVLMKQPDCIDDDKAKLLERVERLERIIDALLAQRAVQP